jgi:hypothetical protein
MWSILEMTNNQDTITKQYSITKQKNWLLNIALNQNKFGTGQP